jgi:hypothetical protein
LFFCTNIPIKRQYKNQRNLPPRKEEHIKNINKRESQKYSCLCLSKNKADESTCIPEKAPGFFHDAFSVFCLLGWYV